MASRCWFQALTGQLLRIVLGGRVLELAFFPQDGHSASACFFLGRGEGEGCRSMIRHGFGKEFLHVLRSEVWKKCWSGSL